MANPRPKKKPKSKPRVVCPLSLPPDLDEQLRAASTATKLSVQDVARLSIERGLKVLLAQLQSTPAA